MTLKHHPFKDSHTGTSSGKKKAFLVGERSGSEKVYFLAKMALYRGQSINCYHLITREHSKFTGRSNPRFESRRDEYMSIGHEIKYPSDIPEDDVDRWVEYGRRAAGKLGLSIQEPRAGESKSDGPFMEVDD